MLSRLRYWDSRGRGKRRAGAITAVVPTPPSATAPTLTQTSVAGANPMAWESTYTDVYVDEDGIADGSNDDYLTCRFRIDGGAWTDETNVLIDSDFVFTYGTDAAAYPWPLFSDAINALASSALVEVQEGILRGGTTTWSTILSDTIAAASWNPDSLWLTTENGDWFSVTDRNTMFQDEAGTSPVTAVGQTIKRWVGKRGNIVFTDATGLTLQNDGTNDYVYGAAGTSKLVSAAAPLTNASGEMTAFGAWQVTSNTEIRELINADDSGVSRLAILLRIPATGTGQTSHYNTAGTQIVDVTANTVTANTRFTMRSKHTTTALEVWLNNTSNGTTAVSGTLRSNNSLLYLFHRSTTTEGRLYKGVCVIGRATTTAEDTEIEAWLA
jgi:hypothetical protein